MKSGKYIVVFCVFTVCFFMINKIAADPGKNDTAPPIAEKASMEWVAFYFHGNFRCDSCRNIEQYSRESIELYFSEQLKTGKLLFKVINTDQAENKHFAEDYQLYTGSLVIVEFKDGKQVRWKNLAKVWNYLNDQDKFYQYVKSEVQKYLEGI